MIESRYFPRTLQSSSLAHNLIVIFKCIIQNDTILNGETG